MAWRFHLLRGNSDRHGLLRGNGIRIGFLSVMVVAASACAGDVVAADVPSTVPQAAAVSGGAHADDDLAIRAQSADYAKAFAKGDIDALAEMWAEDAVYTDESGATYRGRQAIRDQMGEFFKRNGKQPLTVTIQSVEFPSDTTAIEHGITGLANSSSHRDKQNYTAVHVKRNGKWQMVSVTESPYTPNSGMKDLSWLIGDWSVQGPGGDLHLKSDWVAGGKLMCLTVETSHKNGSKTSQTEYVFWNPRQNRLSSWQFDWTGGYGTAWWEQSGDAWIRHAVSVEPDGRLGRANYVLRRVDDNSFSWQSTDRRLQGRRLPDTEKLLVKKQGV